MKRNKRLRIFLNRWHVYGGLFTVGFLLTFSYSAFYHQHHPKSPRESTKKTEWEQRISIPEIEDSFEYKLAIRDSLGIFGHAPWWEDYRDSLGIHHFMIARPGKKYWITVPVLNDVFKVEEIRTGFWKVAVALHPLSSGMSGHGKSPFFIKLWKVLSFLTALVLLGVILITVHFWYIRSFKRSVSWKVVVVVLLIPIVLIIFIWLVG